MKRKKRRFRADKAVRAVARERIGSPPPSHAIPDPRKSKTEKHKKSLLKELEE